MLLKRNPILKVQLLITLFMMPPGVIADAFLDVYLGGSDSRAENNYFKINGVVVRDLDETEGSLELGMRMGYWSENNPWFGLAVDMSVFEPESSELFIFDYFNGLGVIPISTLLMLRPPFPGSRIQPYLGAGPGIFITEIRNIRVTKTLYSDLMEDSSVDVGIDARAGITFLFSQYSGDSGIFLEYRYTEFSPALKNLTNMGQVKYHPTIRTNHLVLGVTLQF